MRPVLTPDQMRALEARYFETSGVASIDLMEVAATRLAEAVQAALPAGGVAYFACGTGGNGGDGLAAARLLAQQGCQAEILLPAPPRTPDACENLRRAEAISLPVHGPEAYASLNICFWLCWVFVAARAFSCSERGLLFAVVHGLLIALATLVVGHRL